MIHLVISVIVILFLLYYFSNVRALYKKTAPISGPFSFPLIGCSYLLLGKPEYMLNQLIKAMNAYKSPIRFPVGPSVLIGTVNPDQIKTILCSNKTMEKHKLFYDFFSVIIGRGLVTAESKIDRAHRKILQPTIAQKVLESFVSIFQENSLLLIRAVEDQIGCPEFDFFPHIEKAFFSNICESTMGMSLKDHKEEIEKYLHANKRGMELIHKRATQVWLHDDRIFNLSQNGKETYKCRKVIYDFIQKILEKRRQYLKSASIKSKGISTNNETTTLLDIILKLSGEENKFTDQEILDHVATTIVAGYDTVSRTLNFIVLMLASHPEIQDKVYQEIYDLYGGEDVEKNPVRNEDLQHLKYLERVIKETMRLFPVAPLLFREVTEDLDLDGYLVPKGCGVVIATLGLHRNEEIWPNAFKFDPDRFLPEIAKERHPCAFIPFSYGTRDCFGRVYAMMSMKVFVASFLRKYILKKERIIPVKDIRIEMDALLKTVEPVTFRIEKRKN